MLITDLLLFNKSKKKQSTLYMSYIALMLLESEKACLRSTSVSCHAELGRGQLVVWRTTSEIRTKGCIFGKSESERIFKSETIIS